MKKVYCDRCGHEMEQNGNILLRKEMGDNHLEDYFDICDKCRDAFFGWLNNKPAEQEKPAKQKPAKKMLPAWVTIKQLATIFGQSERRMNRLMARTGASRRKAKEGLNWWYEYHITPETYDYLIKTLS
jgi:hypothetical protein